MNDKEKRTQLLTAMTTKIYAACLVNLDEATADFESLKKWAYGEAESILNMVEEDQD